MGTEEVRESSTQPFSVESMSIRPQEPPEKGSVQTGVSKNLSSWCPQTVYFKTLSVAHNRLTGKKDEGAISIFKNLELPAKAP